ncbi:polyprenol phosphomannose-dependent alpha 1,6 mannosyltransferase MptB [Streptomyces sp. BPSDS2]|uniref:polyprenol phosphomannose-dependent alpha 1,6 mannosyltransferase MptB n=1 Tax=Streptomyces sp. BPSDS2 TaxID=2571021 RepID=UPI0010C2148B|nr:polyprenol phosphomannose-dependent alpha 1,6 mannosyltransferase MptB [Streptomyces sp. BPSDS2]
MWALSAVGHRRLGAAGSLAVVAGGWFAGKLPVHDPWGLWTDHGSTAKAAAAVLAYAGLTVLVVAWWQYGKTASTARETLVTLAWWTAPFLLAPPLYSADVYSYIAQGSMVVEGHDVYTVGPSALDPGGIGGDAAASVGNHWRDTPAPYGPLFLLISAAVAWTTGGTIVPAVLAMRVVALLSLALIVWSLRRLAREHGRSESRALWLGALNPLLLIHVVGGMHNDGLMIGLMLAGFVLALRGKWIAGSALIGLAMMVKSPAAVSLLFIGVLVHASATGPRWRRWAKGLLAPGLIACAVAGGATLISGTGFGWLHTQGVAANIHTALSVSSDLGLGLGELAHLLLDVEVTPVKSAVQTLGLAVALGLILVLARRAMRGGVTPAHALGLSLLALVALSPMVQPWYLLWGMAVVAATEQYGRLSAVLIVLSAALVYETHPMGATPPYGFALAGLAAVLGTLAVRRNPVVPPDARLPGQRGPTESPENQEAPGSAATPAPAPQSAP